MRRLLLFILFIIFLAPSCKKGKNNPDACNGRSTRRDVKLCIDDEASQIDSLIIVASVDSMGTIELPDVDKETGRLEVEKQIFSVEGRIHKLSKHRDGDWKVKLTDGNDKFLNCEVPNLYCSYAEASPYYLQFYRVREWIELNKEDMEGKMVRITGVAFADIDHNYPRNAADNNIELHPILTIEFL